MKINITNILLTVLIVIILIGQLKGCSSSNVVENVVKETTEVITIKKIDSMINDKLSLITPEKKIVYITPKGKVKKSNPKKEDVKKELNEYKDTTNLKNGTVYSKILSDGKVYSNEIKLISNDSIIYKTRETTKTIVQSKVYGTVGVEHDLNNVSSISIGGIYTYKNKWLIGVEGGYDRNSPNNLYTGIKIGFGF